MTVAMLDRETGMLHRPSDGVHLQAACGMRAAGAATFGPLQIVARAAADICRECWPDGPPEPVSLLQRMGTPAGSTPDGEGWLKEWRPQPGVTFLAQGALTRSLVALEPGPPRGLVGIDVEGKWNHGARDTLSLVVHPDVAREWSRDLAEAADAAERDEARVRRRGR